MQKFIKKLINKNKNRKFKNEVEKEKRKSHIWLEKEKSSFKKRKSKFKIFKTKKIYRDFNEIKKSKYNTESAIIWIVLILSVIYVVFFSSYFSVEKIYIERQDDMVNINISYKSVEDFYFKSIFFVDKKIIKEKIIQNQESIENIKIKKILPNTIKINISSYEKAFNTKIQNKDFIVLENWSLIPNNHDKNILELKTNIKNLDNYQYLDYKKFFKQEDIKNSKIISSLFKNNLLYIKLDYLEYFPEERETHIILKDNKRLIFYLKWELENQIKKLVLFYQNYSNTWKKDLIYIDLRIKERIYYCEKNKHWSCRNNLKLIYKN